MIKLNTTPPVVVESRHAHRLVQEDASEINIDASLLA